MKIKIIPLLLLCTPLKAPCQNLLANGSFEDVNTCTEYRAQCAPAAWFITSPVEIGWPGPKDGERTLSFVYDNIYKPMTKRSFPYTRILCPLRAEKEYDLSFWLYTGSFDFSHLEVQLKKADPARTLSIIGRTTPTLSLSAADIVEKDKEGWMLLRKRFKAEEEKNFILLGNLMLSEPYPASLEKKLKPNAGNIVFWMDDIHLAATDTAQKICSMYSYYREVLYEEHHRHTKHLYLDSFVMNSVPRRSPPDPPGGAEISPPLFLPPPMDTLLIPGILFATNSSVINPTYSKLLDSFILRIGSRPLLKMEIDGHTDNTASDEFNRLLSLHRAESIRRYIVERLPAPGGRIVLQGYGRDRPRAPNDTPANKAKNRRVEILLIY